MRLSKWLQKTKILGSTVKIDAGAGGAVLPSKASQRVFLRFDPAEADGSLGKPITALTGPGDRIQFLRRPTVVRGASSSGKRRFHGV